ncbi:MAG: hypothetical protein ACXQTI_04005 [Candidatus Nezhaarchaeales archaeon]
MPTGEDAQTQTLLLDPILSFGLVSTQSKTKSFSDVAVAQKTVVNDNAWHVVAVLKNKTQPAGVTFTATLRLRFTVPSGTSGVIVDNTTTTGVTLSSGYMTFAMHDPNDTSNVINNTGQNVTIRNITTNQEATATPGDSAQVNASEGDVIEIILPYKDGWEIKAMLNVGGNITDLSIFYRVDVTIYHDGSLPGGKGVTCSFEVYDADGSTLLGTYTFEGLVNPFAQAQVRKGLSVKAGVTRVETIDLGDYVLDPSAPHHYLRVIVAGIKDRGTGQQVSLDDFNVLQVGLTLRDEQDNVVASTPIEDVTELPFHGSWSDVISPPDTQTTYKAKLQIAVNPKYAKHYEIDAIVQLGM